MGEEKLSHTISDGYINVKFIIHEFKIEEMCHAARWTLSIIDLQVYRLSYLRVSHL